MIPKASVVFALAMVPSAKTLMLWQDPLGLWTLPFGPVGPDEDEAATVKSVAKDQVGHDVKVKRQVGPQYVYGGRVAKAYDCELQDRGGAGSLIPAVADVRSVTLEEFLTLPLADEELRRVILDAYSIMEEPEDVGQPDDVWIDLLPIDQIMTSHDSSRLIEVDDERQTTWRRIDPASPTGFYQP